MGTGAMSATQSFYNRFHETMIPGEKAGLLFSMGDSQWSKIPALPRHALLSHFAPRRRTGLPNYEPERRNWARSSQPPRILYSDLPAERIHSGLLGILGKEGCGCPIIPVTTGKYLIQGEY